MRCVISACQSFFTHAGRQHLSLLTASHYLSFSMNFFSSWKEDKIKASELHRADEKRSSSTFIYFGVVPLRTVLNLGPSWPRHKSPHACWFLMSRRVCQPVSQALWKPGMSQRCLCCRRQRVGWETSEKLCAQDFLLGVALGSTRPQFISLAALPYPQFVSECEQVLFLCVLAELWCFCGGCEVLAVPALL